MWFVYIIESLKDGDWYKGCTQDCLKRLDQHNKGLSSFTKSKCPWRLIYVEEFDCQSEALLRERKLKRCNKNYLRWLVKQPVNLINSYLDR